MKLNEDILFDYLSQRLPLKRYGSGKGALHLLRPEFYIRGNNSFVSNHLYISLADHLPDAPRFGEGVVIISVGGIPPVSYTTGRCTCLSVPGSFDLFAVFNSVQAIFNDFDRWEAALQRIYNENCDIDSMVRLSTNLLGIGMTVLDQKFEPLANNNENDHIDLDNYSQAMEYTKVDMSTKTPFLIEQETSSLCLNLFDSQEVYIGSLTFNAVQRALRPSDRVLIGFLGRFLEQAIISSSIFEEGDYHSSLKSLFSELLQGLPSNLKRLHQLEEYKTSSRFICIKIMPVGKLYAAPMEFACNLVESSIPNTVAVSYEDYVVAFVEVDTVEQTNTAIENFVNKMEVKMGVSQSFSEILQARAYYRQASIAIEYGSRLSPDTWCFRFSDYRLEYMLSHCTGEFPLELMLPDGLRSIYKRDSEQDSDYIQTLQTYLDNNMNVSKTAAVLFLHRSSLIDRLKRIEKYWDADLNDPKQRLEVQLLLRAMKLADKNKLGL